MVRFRRNLVFGFAVVLALVSVVCICNQSLMLADLHANQVGMRRADVDRTLGSPVCGPVVWNELAGPVYYWEVWDGVVAMQFDDGDRVKEVETYAIEPIELKRFQL